MSPSSHDNFTPLAELLYIDVLTKYGSEQNIYTAKSFGPELSFISTLINFAFDLAK